PFLLIRVAWFCVKDHGFTRHSAVIGPKFCVARVLANEDKQPNRCVNLLLSHTDLVKVMPIANDFPGGCPGVRLVEDYNVCFLRWLHGVGFKYRLPAVLLSTTPVAISSGLASTGGRGACEREAFT